MNSIKVVKLFANNDDACTEYLCNLRWDKQPECPYCNSKKTGLKSLEKGRRRRLICHSCNKSFSPTVNTIMHGTHIPLWKWFLAISLLAEAKKSVSSRRLSKHLGISVKSAYKLSQRIRKGLLGMRSPILESIIEIDETYIKCKPRHKKDENIDNRGRGTDKVMVVDVAERKGKMAVMLARTGDFKQSHAKNMILKCVGIGKNEIHMDEYEVYNKVSHFAEHKRVNHSAKQYVVRGNTHTNSVEGYWDFVKRAWYETHHNYTTKYLPLYIAEAMFRYDMRKEEPSAVFNFMLGAVSRDV